MTKLLAIATFALFMLLGANHAQATPVDCASDPLDCVTFALVQADLSGHPGDALTWMYQFTNNSGQGVLALGVTPSAFDSSTGTVNPLVFDFFGEPTLPDGAMATGPLLEFDSNPLVPNSFNSGTFDLSVLFDDGTFGDLFANYSATITPGTAPVPEPGVTVLLGAGLAGLLLLRRFRLT
jgi:PEP-CTERM motif